TGGCVSGCSNSSTVASYPLAARASISSRPAPNPARRIKCAIKAMSSWYAIFGLLLVLVHHPRITAIVQLGYLAHRDSSLPHRSSTAETPSMRLPSRRNHPRRSLRVGVFQIRHPSLDALGTGGRGNAAEPMRCADLDPRRGPSQLLRR